MFKSGDEVILNDTFNHTSYGAAMFLQKGEKVRLVNKLDLFTGVAWVVELNGLNQPHPVPETLLSVVEDKLVGIKAEFNPDLDQVWVWAYTKSGKPVTISVDIPHDLKNLDRFKVTIREGE